MAMKALFRLVWHEMAKMGMRLAETARRHPPLDPGSGRPEVPGRLDLDASGSTGRAGFTFVEVMFALTLLLFIVCTAMYGLMASVQTNRQTRLQILANSVVRTVSDEVYSVTPSGAASDSATAVIAHYAGYDGMTGSLGANGSEVRLVELTNGGKTLLYRFPVVVDGESIPKDGGIRENDLNDKATGELLIYLDETFVPPLPGADAIWEDRGVGANARRLASGYDMNRDGVIAAPAVVPSMSLLRDNPSALGIRQVPIDITVTFYGSADHKTSVYRLARRIVITKGGGADGGTGSDGNLEGG